MNPRASVLEIMFAGSQWCAVALALVGWLGLSVSSQAATIVVTNWANTGAGTLRTALINARNGDVITFAVAGTLTNATTYDGLTISNNASIVGPGADLLAITGTNRNRARPVPVDGPGFRELWLPIFPRAKSLALAERAISQSGSRVICLAGRGLAGNLAGCFF